MAASTGTVTTSPRPVINPMLVLGVGLIAVTSAAIMIRAAQGQGVPSLVIAAGRLLVATVVLTPVALQRYRAELRGLSRREIRLCLVSGVFLALHFALWITSLEFSSVVSSLVLVTTNPLWVVILSFPLLGERVRREVVIGIVLAFIGGIMVALSGDAGEAPTRPAPLLGNMLAGGGAITYAIYLLIGRRVRAKLPVIPYIWLVYGTAAFTLIVVLPIKGEQVGGLPLAGYAAILGLGLIPQLLGHSSFNYALGYFSAAFVSMVVLVEPIATGILALIVFDEIPTLPSVIGAAIILLGLGIAALQPDVAEAEIESEASL